MKKPNKKIIILYASMNDERGFFSQYRDWGMIFQGRCCLHRDPRIGPARYMKDGRHEFYKYGEFLNKLDKNDQRVYN